MLFVDHRRGSAELVRPLELKGLEVVKMEFPAGDIVFTGKGEKGAPVSIGIEYKKVSELCGSLRTGRLQGHQLLEMRGEDRGEFDFAYLLVEGEMLFDKVGMLQRRQGWGGKKRTKPIGMTHAELMKRIFVLHLCGGLNYIRTVNQRETVATIEHLYRVWTDKNLDEHSSHIGIYQPAAIAPISEFRQMIAPLDGIGLRTSAALEAHCGGKLSRLFRMTPRDLAEITTHDDKGKARRVGDTNAAKIFNALQRVL